MLDPTAIRIFLMTVFGNYAKYYDLLYKDKDYAKEVNYLSDLLLRFRPSAKSILELGCGTGKHAQLLAENGFSVSGVDMSLEMLAKAELRLADLPDDIAAKLNFSQGDVRTFRNDKKFNAVISLFHVASYQSTNKDLTDYFTTARAHLDQGGIFIFDCWYGPAVLTERPESRIKHLENEDIIVERKAEPVLFPNENRVDVNYDIIITDKKTNSSENIKETHPMRYLFKPEIEFFMEQTGFELISCEEWLTGTAPGFDTWGVCCVGRVK